MEVLGEHFGKADLRQLRKRIGWVHGDLASDFPAFMNCREVVTSGVEGSIAWYEDLPPQAVERADRALRSIGADGLGDRVFRTLSTGERQRVVIARALAAGPELLILDEPCLGLDPVSRESFLRALGILFEQQPGLTVIGVTHHVEEIISGYDRILMLAGGRVVDQGSIHEVMNGPGLARIYGADCRVEADGGRYHLRFTRS